MRIGVEPVAYYIVEDDAAVADALLGLLLEAGHEAEAFSSAESFLRAGPPGGGDTVVIDLGLPGIPGSTLLAWLSALADPPRMVVISGKSSRVIEREIGTLTPARILRKPPAADWFEAIAG